MPIDCSLDAGANPGCRKAGGVDFTGLQTLGIDMDARQGNATLPSPARFMREFCGRGPQRLVGPDWMLDDRCLQTPSDAVARCEAHLQHNSLWPTPTQYARALALFGRA